MKNNLFTKKLLDSDTLLSAVYKAREKAGVLNSSTEQSVLGSTRNHGDLTSNETTLKSKLDRVEDRLNDAESKFTPTTTLVNYGKIEPGKKIILVEDRNTVDEGYEERKEQERAKEAFERILRNKLYGEPLAEKPVPLDRGVYSIGDAGSAPLRSGGPLDKNGAHTRGYTDTASDTGVPIQFTGGTFKEIERKYNDAMARQTDTMNEFNEYLENSYIDLSNLTAEQEDILDLVKKELTKKSVLGTLTDAEKNSVFDKTLRFLYSNTRSANGDPYPVFIDIVSLDPKAPYVPTKPNNVPEIGAVKPDAMSDEAYKVVTDYLSPENQAKIINDAMKIYAGARREGDTVDGDYTQFLKNDYSDYMNQLNREAKDHYVAARREGDVKAGDYKPFSDWATEKFYEHALKPIYPKKDEKGNGIGESVPIGEFIPPEYDYFGADVARAAIQLLGLTYEAKAGHGNRPDIEIDCQGLVRWALCELDTDLGDFGVGKGARYQINHSKKIWDWSEGLDIGDGWQIGDTLFWAGDETGEIKHTAIFIGWKGDTPLVIEAFHGSVQIVEVRVETHNRNGENSTLYQVNRMTPEDLQVYVDKNKPKGDD